MVIPFLSVYLVNALNFSLTDVGWIMTFYGLGAVLGTFIGGKLTDLFGYYWVIVASLFLGGLGFIFVQFFDGLYTMCAVIFVLMTLADSYRPAVFVAAEAYSKPENLTRSIALIRLAINLGFSFGPMLGGIIIAKVSYGALFWIDGITCMAAVVAMLLTLKRVKLRTKQERKAIIKHGRPPQRNRAYMSFILVIVLISIVFVQYFSLIPIYYAKIYELSEDVIGWLMFLNGALIVLTEMPLVAWLEKSRLSKTGAVAIGTGFLAVSLLVLNLGHHFSLLIIGMILMTIGEMIESPFSNALAIEMAPEGRKGSYMGMFSMSWSVSHIVGHNAGMNMADRLGFRSAFYIFGLGLLAVAVFSSLLKKKWETSITFTKPKNAA